MRRTFGSVFVSSTPHGARLFGVYRIQEGRLKPKAGVRLQVSGATLDNKPRNTVKTLALVGGLGDSAEPALDDGADTALGDGAGPSADGLGDRPLADGLSVGPADALGVGPAHGLGVGPESHRTLHDLYDLV